jgi:hypothetical protein
MLLVCIGSYLKWGLWYNVFNFGNPLSGHYIYVGKNVMIRGYFSKQTGVRKKKVWETLHYVIRPIWGWRRCIDIFLE